MSRAPGELRAAPACPGRRLGVMGGTFDPIHLGHLAAATAAADRLRLDHVLFVPSHQPPHRPATPRISAFQRFALVALAVAGDARFVASDLELSRPGPSFTAETLRRLQGLGHPASQLFFIIGTDAFAEIATWHDYPAVLDLAHFVVLTRPGHPRAGAVERLPDVARRLVALAEEGDAPLPPLKSGAILLLDASTPDVSATGIRERVGRGQPVVGLVPPAVAAHIGRHGLYGPDPSHAGR